MKKLTMALALALCLVLCVFAFASCGKKKKGGDAATDAATSAATSAATDAATDAATNAATDAATDAATEPETDEVACEHVWDEGEEFYVVDEEPSCLVDGSKSYHCKLCGKSVPGTEVTIPAAHTPDDKYVILLPPTCLTPGSQILYCLECGEEIPGSEVEIEPDPDAHVVNDWDEDLPTLLKPTGSRTGVCEICDEEIVEELTFKPYIYSSKLKNGAYADSNSFAVAKKAVDIRGDKHFAPSEEDGDGNDLWFEYSFLWNDTLHNWDSNNCLAEIKMFGFRDTNNWSSHREFYYLYTRDNNDGFFTSNDCPYVGHFDYSTYDVDASPAQNCADDLTDLGNTLNGQPIGRYGAGWTVADDGKAASPYIYDDETQTMGGWHRLGFRYHQEAAINDGKVVYSGYTELYVDGVLCWRVHTNFKPGHEESLVTKKLLLWTAEIDPEDPEKLIYTENDALRIELRLDGVAASSEAVYLVVDDPIWTCGDGFALAVERIEEPTPDTLTLAEGVDCDAAIYFRAVEAE